MAISNELLSSTLYSIRDGEVDQLFQKVAFLDLAKKFKGIEYEDGGTKIQRPLALSEHSSVTALQTGYESVSLAVSDVMQPAIYDWADFAAPIVITQKEELENKGEKAIVNILEARMRSVMGTFRRGINKQILANSASAVFVGLNSLNGGVTTGSATGFLEDDAVLSQTNIVGGISKATYAALPGWQNGVGTASGAFGTNGLRVMAAIWTYCDSRAPMGSIDAIIASESAFANYKRSLQANERYVDLKALDGGRMALSFNGAPVVQDLEMPATAGASSKPFSMYFLNFSALKLVVHKDADFAISPFSAISGTTARAAQLYWKGQLIADHLASEGVLYDGDTY